MNFTISQAAPNLVFWVSCTKKIKLFCIFKYFSLSTNSFSATTLEYRKPFFLCTVIIWDATPLLYTCSFVPCQSNLHLAAYPVTIVGLCPCLELTAGQNAFEHRWMVLLSLFRREMSRLWHVREGRKHQLVNHEYVLVIFSAVCSFVILIL